MLPAVVIFSISFGFITVSAATVMGVPFLMALLGYPIGGAIGLLLAAVMANLTAGRKFQAAESRDTATSSMHNLQQH